MSIVESLAIRLYGWGPDEARKAGVCIRCHQPIGYNDLEPVDRRLYDLSALCGGCFHAIMADHPDCGDRCLCYQRGVNDEWEATRD